MTKQMETPQKDDWNRFWDRDQSQQFKNISWSKRRVIKVLDAFTGEGKKALDAGCGSGFFSKYFCDKGMPTTSLDYSKSALDMARSVTEGRSKIIQGDLLSLQNSEIFTERYHLIFSDGLLEHFSQEDQNKIMQNLKSVLTQEGVIVTFVPNRWSPWELIRPFFMPGIDEEPFVLNQLVALNERNDLEVLAAGGVNTLPFSISPEGSVAKVFGMLLYTVSRKK